jgi:hypothetical protein
MDAGRAQIILCSIRPATVIPAQAGIQFQVRGYLLDNRLSPVDEQELACRDC